MNRDDRTIEAAFQSGDNLVEALAILKQREMDAITIELGADEAFRFRVNEILKSINWKRSLEEQRVRDHFSVIDEIADVPQ